MQALIYTKDDQEFEKLQTELKRYSDSIEVYRDPLDRHGHYSKSYDVVIVALDGARGMNEVSEWSDRYPFSRIIWITEDKDFAGIAMRKHISDLIVRPYDEERIRESVSFILREHGISNMWNIPAVR